jgi:hypothetical protein
VPVPEDGSCSGIRPDKPPVTHYPTPTDLEIVVMACYGRGLPRCCPKSGG